MTASPGTLDALRAELGLERMDLLGHSAGGTVALLYAAAHPERVGRLILLTPSVRALGLTFSQEEQRAAMRRRSAEPWFEAAWAAAQAADDGDDSAETTLGYQPFCYGRWDDAARAHAAMGLHGRAGPARSGFYAEGAFDPPAIRAALARLTAPVLVYAGRGGRRVPSGPAGPGGRAVPPLGPHRATGRRTLSLAG